MKESKKRIDTVTQLALILVLVAAVVMYFFIYYREVEQRDAVHAECNALQTRLEDLSKQEENRANYEQQMEEAEDALRGMLAKYSAGHTPEKSILFVKEMEEAVGITIPNVSFSSPTVLTTVDLSGIGAEQEWKRITFLKEPLSFSYRCDYDTLKETLRFLREYPEHRTLQSVSMSYDSERGILSGNMAINLYSVTGGDKVYLAPETEDVPLGRDNLFAEDTGTESSEEETKEAPEGKK